MIRIETLDTVTIIKIFKDISDCVETIKSFSFGTTFDANKIKDLEYPHLFLEVPTQLNWTIPGPSQAARREFTVAFQIITRAREGASGQKQGEDSYKESGAYPLTITEHATGVILSILYNNFKKNILKGSNFSALPVYEGYEDNVYGYRVEGTLHQPSGIETCDIPLNPDLEDCLFDPTFPSGGGSGSRPKCPQECLDLINQNTTDIVLLDERVSNIESDVTGLSTYRDVATFLSLADDTNYYLTLDAQYDSTIEEFNFIADTGQFDIAIEVNGVNVFTDTLLSGTSTVSVNVSYSTNDNVQVLLSNVTTIDNLNLEFKTNFTV